MDRPNDPTSYSEFWPAVFGIVLALIIGAALWPISGWLMELVRGLR